MASRFKVSFVWWPKRLIHRDGDAWRFVGWVWLQRAYLVNNVNYGWVAFVDGQTDENMSKCPSCKRSFAKEPENTLVEKKQCL